VTHFTSLQIRNFKRFAGENHIPLSGEGQVTVIAAQNGVGKTTVLDAFHLTLHGKRVFKERYPGKQFNEWIHNAYSIESEEEEYPYIQFALELSDPIHDDVRVQRTYWLLPEDDGGVTEELVVTKDGKPLELESGENKLDYTEAWIEALLPLPLSRRFLVDGERLSDFDPQEIDEELIESIDDLLEIGMLQKLDTHLQTIHRETVRKMVPEDEHETLENLLNLRDEYKSEVTELESGIKSSKAQRDIIQNRIDELNELFQNESLEEESEVANLRIGFAIKQSELTSVRRDVLDRMTTSLPFLIAGLPVNLQDWNVAEVKAALESERLNDENLKFMSSVLNSLDPSLGERSRNRIEKAANDVASSSVHEEVSSPLAHLSLDALSIFEKRYDELGMSEAQEDIQNTMANAMSKLNKFNKIATQLRSATEGLSISEMANELKEKGMEFGGLQADISRMSDELLGKENAILTIEKQIENIQSKTDKDSHLNRKKETILLLRGLLEMYAVEHRSTMAQPLEDRFKEGFELLSRKSDRLEKITVNPRTYQTELKMAGFPGNWLDRDLSATERQHVGLSLLYALRKVGNRPIPVVIDTPTSRMDRDHKGWSVTRFYPELSHQVIVLATSDDLGDGLYDELKQTKNLGLELLIEEISDNTVKVSESNLAAFFGE